MVECFFFGTRSGQALALSSGSNV